jgi:hypothetical protein
MSSESDLCDRMRARADARGYGADHPLRVRANELDETIKGCYGNPQSKHVRQLLGAWARARKAWCDETGESLI